MRKNHRDERGSQVRVIKRVAVNHLLSQPPNIEVGMLALPKAVSEGKWHESIKCCLGQHKSHGGVNFNKIEKKRSVRASRLQFRVHFTIVNDTPSHSKCNRDKEVPCNCQKEKRVL